MTYDYYDSTFEAPYDDGDASPYDDWTHGELQAELERTEHDLAVAVHEATAARRAASPDQDGRSAGFDVDLGEVNPVLKPHQAAIVRLPRPNAAKIAVMLGIDIRFIRSNDEIDGLTVAVHEATAARRRLAEITDPGADRVASIVRVDTTDDVTLELIRRVLWDVGGWVEMDHAASVAVARAIAAALREHVPNQEQHP